MSGETRRLPGSLHPTPEDIQFKEEYLNRKFPGESKWKFVMIDPDTVFQRSDELPSDEGPMWVFRRE